MQSCAYAFDRPTQKQKGDANGCYWHEGMCFFGFFFRFLSRFGIDTSLPLGHCAHSLADLRQSVRARDAAA